MLRLIRRIRHPDRRGRSRGGRAGHARPRAARSAHRPLHRAGLVGATGVALVLSGCVHNTEGAGEVPVINLEVQVDAALAAQVPEAIRQRGNLIVGVNIPYAPNEFRDHTGRIVGFDIDLFNAVAAVLDLQVDWRDSQFDTIIPSIQAGTYDLGASSFTDTAERQDSVDFVNYFNAGVRWATQPGREIDPDNACGLKVAVQLNTVEETEEIPEKDRACREAGRPGIEKLAFDEQNEAVTATVVGKADALSADSPVTAYGVAKARGKLVFTGELFDAAPYGWPMRKGSPLAQLLSAALGRVMESGAYRQIAEAWGVTDGLIAAPTINAGE